ncbi:hypothetical protein GJ744_005131 [Endocarpon pusillum]|uniref:Uncharacterized protein n=1 Tax=Endocarpon pusillum TaxID=364733 RepID=A0A8H7APP2_9EURO|nr:hypothetical protein GJ744_005131 [Endocarpon pusillum]
MPLIEELPVTTTQRTTQGWAYVPDIKQPIQPLEARKRGRNQGASKGEISAKQQKAIQTKLNELDKENYKDTTIAIPAKSKERAGKKITPNVRRILTYQRTFAHYLADDESKQTPMQPPPRPASTRRPSVATTPTQASTLKRERSSSRSVTSTPSTPQPTDSGRFITPQVEPPLPQLPPPPPTTPQNPTSPSQNLSSSKDPDPDPDPDLDSKNPLLRSHPHLNLKPPPSASCKPSSPNRPSPTPPRAPSPLKTSAQTTTPTLPHAACASHPNRHATSAVYAATGERSSATGVERGHVGCWSVGGVMREFAPCLLTS